MLCFKYTGLKGSVVGKTVVPIEEGCYWRLQNKSIQVKFTGAPMLAMPISKETLPKIVSYDSSLFYLEVLPVGKVEYFNVVIKKNLEIFFLLFWDYFHDIPIVLENPILESCMEVERLNRPMFDISFESFSVIRNYLQPKLVIGGTEVQSSKALVRPGRHFVRLKSPMFVDMLSGFFTPTDLERPPTTMENPTAEPKPVKNLLQFMPDSEYKHCIIRADGQPQTEKGFEFDPGRTYALSVAVDDGGEEDAISLPEGVFNLKMHSYEVEVANGE